MHKIELAAAPVLEVSGLRKEFGSVKAIAGIDFSVQSGEVVALLGPNGAGKTTAIDTILGLTVPSAGKVKTFARAPRLSVREGRVGAVLQTGGLPRDMRVGTLIKMVAGTFTYHAEIEKVLERAQLTEIVGRKISKCSGGEQQRVRLALALLPEPDLFVLDEPTAGMDTIAREHFWNAMHAEAKRGATIIFATHYLPEAEQFADRTIIMHKGKIVADGKTSTVRQRFGMQKIRLSFADTKIRNQTQLALAQKAITVIEGEDLVVSGSDTVNLAKIALNLGGVTHISIADTSLDDAFHQLAGE